MQFNLRVFAMFTQIKTPMAGVRDEHFRRARVAIRDSGIDFYCNMGNRLLADLNQCVKSHSDPSARFDAVRKVLNANVFHQMMSNQKQIYDPLIRDVPAVLAEIIAVKECPPELHEATLSFMQHHHKAATAAQASSILEVMQRAADDGAAREERSTDRQFLTWTPAATRRYLEKVGKFVTVPVAFRVQRPAGGFNVVRLRPHLCAIRLLDS